MKIPSILRTRALGAATMAVVCLLAIPYDAEAKGPKGDKHGQGHNSKNRQSHHNDHDRRHYSSRPRSTFILTFGNGYAGRGYYYGPPNSPYYYERSDVRYYATREAAPRGYYGNDGYRSNSEDAAVQRALARRGYYHGSIDGQLGPQSRRAIARYQRDHGLRETGTITSGLLQSLGL